jgi:hypothetical protein
MEFDVNTAPGSICLNHPDVIWQFEVLVDPIMDLERRDSRAGGIERKQLYFDGRT